MSKIKTIQAREILASGGAPSLEVTVTLESGAQRLAQGEASVSYGASAGSKEAFVLTDGDKSRYDGKGMLKAVANINGEIADLLIGKEAGNQREIDELMIKADGTENKNRLGGNAILGVSLAASNAAAHEKGIPLYKHIREVFDIKIDGWRLPRPMIVMIEGGKHADETTDLQEYLVAAMGERTAEENVRMGMEIYEALKKILKNNGLSTNVGNEGAFAPNGLKTNEQPIEFLVKAIEAAGYKPGVDVGISIDAAASEFYDVGSTIYDLRIEQKKLTSEELIEYYAKWIDKYPFVSWEDMLSEFDWDSWPKMVARIKGKFPLIADDLTVTNTRIWKEAIEKKAATAILIKLNQAGTLTETVDCCLEAKRAGFWTIPSHRGGGETNDTFMVDLAVAMGSEYIKVGPTRGERVCKYNRLMRIEEEIKLVKS